MFSLAYLFVFSGATWFSYLAIWFTLLIAMKKNNVKQLENGNVKTQVRSSRYRPPSPKLRSRRISNSGQSSKSLKAVSMGQTSSLQYRRLSGNGQQQMQRVRRTSASGRTLPYGKTTTAQKQILYNYQMQRMGTIKPIFTRPTQVSVQGC